MDSRELFLSTLSLRRATCNFSQKRHPLTISIHALLAESDAVTRVASTPTTVISIHALLAESDIMHALELAGPVLFLSTLSLRRATGNKCCKGSNDGISIHALLAESDKPGYLLAACHGYFYPRSPCGERQAGVPFGSVPRLFLSTLSLRRATRRATGTAGSLAISIHALLAESDICIIQAIQ